MSSELTGSAFDFMRMDLLCPKCGKTNKEPIRELTANDTVACRYCGETIDLNAKATRASITKFAHEAKEIEILKSG
jgi:DNA-directed RNA polymerase subunit RPC12/RpoP